MPAVNVAVRPGRYESMTRDDIHYLLSNARTVVGRKHLTRPWWALAMDLFGVGSTFARELCQRGDIDPDMSVDGKRDLS